MRGKFITFEGCEGVGKSTQMNLLKQYLETKNIDMLFTREPGGTNISEQIRAIILNPENEEMDDLTELLLYIAARRQHVAELIEPALTRGKLVVCDRFTDSTVCYQGSARGLCVKIIDELNDLALSSTKIDLTIFLDVNPELGFLRKGGADKSDRLEKERLDFHKKVYEGFKQLAEQKPERIVTIDASGTKAETHEKVVRALADRGII